jgi:OFA family oxalate/formate antiporter-like MFS transporter
VVFMGINYKHTSNKQPIFSFEVPFAQRKYWFLFIGMFSACFAGLLILSNLKPIVEAYGFSTEVALDCVSIYAMGNMLGRVFWGWVIDKVGSDKTLFMAFCILIISVIFLDSITGKEWMVYLVVFGIAMGFSFSFVTFPNKTRKVFGLEMVGSIYPFVFLGYGLAGILGPFSAGILLDATGSYQIAIWLSAALALVGLLIYWFNRKHLVPNPLS